MQKQVSILVCITSWFKKTTTQLSENNGKQFKMNEKAPV